MAPELTTGETFGAYKLGDLVGRGGMGVVRRAEHIHLGRVVALKLLAPELSDNAEFRDRFLRESRLAAALDHPNIVTVYDAGEVEGILYLAMRFISGTDLSHEIATRGQLPAEEAIDRVAQVGAALDTAHAAGLVHRDVKPANVMIDGPRAYLTDFGLTKQSTAQTAPGLTQSGIFLGTVDYAAPEQIEGKPVDGRADVYALGCVLHECLTATRPYPRDSQVAVLYAHLHEDPPRPSDIRPELPKALDAVIAAAMAKRPQERYSTCAEMVTAARDALAGASWADPTGIRRPAADNAATSMRPSPDTSALPPAPTDFRAAEATRAAPPAPTGGQVGQWAGEPAAQPGPVIPSPPAGPPPSVYGRRRSKLVPVLAVLAAVVVIGVVAAVVLGGGDDGGGKADTGGEQGGVAGDGAPESENAGVPKIVGEFPVGKRPFGVVVGTGVVWVANNSEGSVTRQADDGGLRTDIATGDGPFGVARNRNSVWVANSQAGTVSRIEVATGKADPAVKVGEKPYFLTADDASVFVSNGDSDSITQLNAENGEVIGDPIPVGPDPRGIASSGSAVWVANRGNATVSRVVGGAEVKTFEVGEQPAGVAFGADAIWVANKGDDSVTRVDVRAGGDFGTKTIEVGKEPFGIAFGEGSVWVTNSGDDTVTRIDPSTGDVVGDPIAVKGQPVGISAARGFVWVTSNDTNTLTKIAPNG